MKLETNSRRKTGKFKNMWKLSDALLNNQCVKKEITKKNLKYLKMNENRNITY